MRLRFNGVGGAPRFGRRLVWLAILAALLLPPCGVAPAAPLSNDTPIAYPPAPPPPTAFAAPPGTDIPVGQPPAATAAPAMPAPA